jgi:hypothetical protein
MQWLVALHNQRRAPYGFSPHAGCGMLSTCIGKTQLAMMPSGGIIAAWAKARTLVRLMPSPAELICLLDINWKG